MHQLFGIGSNFGRIADFETLEGSRVLDLGKVSPGAQVVSTLGSIAIIDFIQQEWNKMVNEIKSLKD